MKIKDREILRMNKIRTELSITQTLQACKRTLFSYISTACVFISLAFTYWKLTNVKLDVFVIIMFCIGAAFLIWGIIDYIISRHETIKIMERLKEEYNEEATAFVDIADE